jgi:hypothetical protein
MGRTAHAAAPKDQTQESRCRWRSGPLDPVHDMFQACYMSDSSSTFGDTARAPELTAANPDAQAVVRGISRLFARNDIWCLQEMPLRNARRADMMGIDAKGRIVIVEIKVSRADLLGDGKWPDYLDYCDRFFWGLPPHLDRNCLEDESFRPDCCGVIVADGYDAEIIRPAPTRALAAARRKVEVERLARTSLRRQLAATDPHCAPWAAVGLKADLGNTR